MKDQDLQSPNMLVTLFQSDTWYQNITGCQIFAHSIRPDSMHRESVSSLDPRFAWGGSGRVT